MNFIKKIVINIALKFSRILLREVEVLESKNIKFELSRRSLKSTVDYIESKMPKVVSVDSKWKVHDLAFEKTLPNGAILEFGVFKGETINYIAKKTSAQIYGFDSFEGLPEFWRDGFPKGEFAVNNIPAVRKNVNLIKGWFNESLPVFLGETEFEYVRYLHIDCDLYSSTKTIFDNLKGKIKPGTVIVFDEYFNFPGWENDEFKAFKEFIRDTGLGYEYVTYNNRHEQVAVVIV